MRLDSTLFFYLATIGYFFSFLAYLFYVVFPVRQEANADAPETKNPTSLGIVAATGARQGARAPDWGRWATRLLTGTLLIATVGVVLRVIELGHASSWVLTVFMPLTTTYETLTFFAWIIPLAYWILEWKYGVKQLGVFITGVAFTLLAVASSPSFAPSKVAPIVPSLQSYWLVIHVLFMTIGIAFFTSGFGGSVLLLIERYSGRHWLDPDHLEEFSYKAIVLGFPFYGIGGIVFGGLWADKAWGSYWSWDPKETAMLGAWLVYAVYLHARMAFGWRDLRTTWLSIAGYLAVLYAWIGINYFVASLHSFV